MDKNRDLIIRKVGNGWIVTDNPEPGMPSAFFSFMVFQHLESDQLGVQSDKTLFGFLADHFGA